MKKMIPAIILVAAMLCIAASAVSASVDEVSYKLTGDDTFTAMFNVTSSDDAVAFVSVYDDDGRLIGAKLVDVTAAQTKYTADFGGINDIAYAKISVLESASTLKPVCEHKLVENITQTGDTLIPVGPLFPG